MIDLSGLNREQLEAVLITEGPLLVLAGAGSGKTRVITYRLARLVQKGVRPEAILCVTFTNKAAHEMKARARDLVGRSLRGATISTFHALGARILRAHPEGVGLRPGFTITDSAEQLGTLRRILRHLHMDERRFDPKRVMTYISQAKNAGIDARGLRELDGLLPRRSAKAQEDEDYQLATIEVFERYERALRAQNVVDFDDLLFLTVQLLRRRTEVQERLQRRWRYLMVDEYQDTNGAQLELLTLLTGPEKNLCVVGDDDQSIYGWRGADVRNILGFDRHFGGARRIMLLTNYRSTGHILAVANAIIEKNGERYEKRLRAAGGVGDRVRVSEVEDEDAEADGVVGRIVALTSSGVTAGDIAILFRSKVQSRTFELAFRAAGVPYRVVGGLDLFDKREVKDVLAYLRILHNPEEEQALRRIANWPPRGIGDTTLRRIDEYARDRQIGLFEALSRVDEIDGITAKSGEAALALVSTLKHHRELLDRWKPSTVVRKLLDATAVEQTLLASSADPAAAARRVDNVRAIVRQLERYEQRVRQMAKLDAEEFETDAGLELADADEDLAPEAEVGSLEGFLAELALNGFENVSRKDERTDQVVLSSIHAAKGLEWPHVFLVGWEEQLLPHRRTLDAESDLAEERRLAYVAATRAKAQLTITWARHRTRYGQVVERTRSRFLEGLPEESIENLTDRVRAPKSEAEERALARDWMGKIRADLEAKRTKTRDPRAR